MTPGEQFRFICVSKMAEGMDRLVSAGGGEILDKDVRSYGVVFTVQKQQNPLPGD